MFSKTDQSYDFLVARLHEAKRGKHLGGILERERDRRDDQVGKMFCDSQRFLPLYYALLCSVYTPYYARSFKSNAKKKNDISYQNPVQGHR